MWWAKSLLPLVTLAAKARAEDTPTQCAAPALPAQVEAFTDAVVQFAATGKTWGPRDAEDLALVRPAGVGRTEEEEGADMSSWDEPSRAVACLLLAATAAADCAFGAGMCGSVAVVLPSCCALLPASESEASMQHRTTCIDAVAGSHATAVQLSTSLPISSSSTAEPTAAEEAAQARGALATFRGIVAAAEVLAACSVHGASALGPRLARLAREECSESGLVEAPPRVITVGDTATGRMTAKQEQPREQAVVEGCFRAMEALGAELDGVLAWGEETPSPKGGRDRKMGQGSRHIQI